MLIEEDEPLNATLVSQVTTSDIIALAAAAVAVCALFATIWQAILARRHNRLSVRPLLVSVVDRKIDDAGAEITLLVRNCGVGPAIVKERGFWRDGKPFLADADDEVSAVLQHALASKYPWSLKKHGLPGIGTAIPPGGEHVIASVFFKKYTRQMADIALESGKDIFFRLRYQSLYEEVFDLPSEEISSDKT